MNKQEELLTQILEECLEEDLSFVPPEGEIARTHRFSQPFEQSMEKLLEDSSRVSRRKEIQKHFSPRYGQWAACILVFCVCGWLFYHSGGLHVEKGADMSAAEEEASLPAADSDLAAAPEAVEAEDQLAEEASEELSAAESQDAGSGREGKVYCGNTVYPAEMQKMPERLENVTTLVNCPVLDEENPVLMLTIGNTGEEDIRYLNQYDLEVQLQDTWYRIPAESGEEGRWLTLEAGMAVDEEIDLSEYQIDYDASQYRLVTHVGQETLGVEFTFGEVFKKTKEGESAE